MLRGPWRSDRANVSRQWKLGFFIFFSSLRLWACWMAWCAPRRVVHRVAACCVLWHSVVRLVLASCGRAHAWPRAWTVGRWQMGPQSHPPCGRLDPQRRYRRVPLERLGHDLRAGGGTCAREHSPSGACMHILWSPRASADLANQPISIASCQGAGASSPCKQQDATCSPPCPATHARPRPLAPLEPPLPPWTRPTHLGELLVRAAGAAVVQPGHPKPQVGLELARGPLVDEVDAAGHAQVADRLLACGQDGAGQGWVRAGDGVGEVKEKEQGCAGRSALRRVFGRQHIVPALARSDRDNF
jgi:hypothetical protein